MEEFKLGELVLLERNKRMAKFRCFCGTEFECDFFSVKYGRTMSCGCYHSFLATKRVLKHGGCQNLVGKKQWTRLYEIYMGMKKRCYNKNAKSYPRYGGAGITICTEWLDSFETFQNWALKNGYRKDLTIDRIKGHLGYSPDNCRWATSKVQSVNKNYKTGKSKCTGVTILRSGRFSASISINNVTIHLGTYSTLEEASAVYQKAKKERDEMYLKELKTKKHE